MTRSAFRKSFVGSMRVGRRGGLATAPQVFDYDLEYMWRAAEVGQSFLAVRFTGALPRAEMAIDVNVQDRHLALPLQGHRVVQLEPGTYSVSIYRAGAIKAGVLELAPAEFVVLEFRFSPAGITFSGWKLPAVVSLVRGSPNASRSGDS